MKTGRKRVKHLLNKGFYSVTESRSCHNPDLKFERVDLLLACLVFKSFLIMLFILGIIQ